MLPCIEYEITEEEALRWLLIINPPGLSATHEYS